MGKKLSAKGAVINVKGTDISADVESFEIKQSQPLQKTTGFGEHDNFVQGAEVFEVGLDVWYTTGTYGVLQSAYAVTTGTTVTVKPDPNGQTLSGLYHLENIDPAGNSDGSGIKLGKVTFKPASGGAKPSWA